jgi:rRNA biogenesis protein RRP5
VHISNIADAHVGSLKGYLPEAGGIPTRYPCRVIGLDHYDGRYLVSMKPSVLATPILFPTDIQAGTIMKAKIVSVESFGVFVELAANVRALCPNIYLSDVEQLTQRDKMFKVGSSMKCRVIGVDATTGRITVTFKKSLITSPLPPITGLEGLQPGTLGVGMIVALKSFGCLVSLYNGVRGLVPLSECKEGIFVRDPKDHFRMGQVIKCRVLSVDMDKKQLRLSFKLKASSGIIGNLSIGEVRPSVRAALFPCSSIVFGCPLLI